MGGKSTTLLVVGTCADLVQGARFLFHALQVLWFITYPSQLLVYLLRAPRSSTPRTYSTPSTSSGCTGGSSPFFTSTFMPSPRVACEDPARIDANYSIHTTTSLSTHPDDRPALPPNRPPAKKPRILPVHFDIVARRPYIHEQDPRAVDNAPNLPRTTRSISAHLARPENSLTLQILAPWAGRRRGPESELVRSRPWRRPLLEIPAKHTPPTSGRGGRDIRVEFGDAARLRQDLRRRRAVLEMARVGAAVGLGRRRIRLGFDLRMAFPIRRGVNLAYAGFGTYAREFPGNW
uniref:Uncharacterized protein n=1 Tax=Mycena chlorophos TaxID=658473 RepID=A0ABQ0LCR4_MYCCL|nr:predicted protein [Mycena chlorophos]